MLDSYTEAGLLFKAYKLILFLSSSTSLTAAIGQKPTL